MKTILHIAEAFGGGVVTFLANLANSQCSRYRVVIAHGLRPETHKNFKDFFDPHVEFIKVENFHQQINFFDEIKAIKELRNIIKQVNPDIIHMHSSQSGVLGKLASINVSAVKLYSPHGFAFLKQDVPKWKCAIYKCIEKFFSFFNCTLVASSQTEYDEGKKITHKIKLITNGINTCALDKYLDNTDRFPQFTVGMVGRALPQKNPYLFNKIAQSLPDVHFEWIGDGDLRYMLNSPNIHIVGWGPREEALEYVSKCDIYIMTSLWEGMPIALLEAMYLKKTCIVTNVVGNKDVIKNGHNGYVCNNLQEFIERIEYLKNNEAECIELGKNAHNDILALYTNEIMVQKYDEIINNFECHK